jgi:hypothetical protein
VVHISDIFLGADLKERDSFARTPFHLALQYGHLHLINFLLASFPPGSPDSQPVLSPPPKASFLRLAVESSNSDIVKTVMNWFEVSEADVAKELKRLDDPAFANGFPIGRSYGGGRGRAEVRNPTEWDAILKLLHDFVEPPVSHHAAPPSEPERDSLHSTVQGGNYPSTLSSLNPGDSSSGSHPRPKRDKAHRKRWYR